MPSLGPAPSTAHAWARRLLRTLHPAADVLELVRRTGSQLSSVYEARCADPTHDAILKVYAPEWAWKQTKEVRVYQMLTSIRGLTVPRVPHHVPDGGPNGRAVTVLSLLPGRPLSEVSQDVDPAGIPAFYREMGAALAAVHRIGQEAFGYLTDRIVQPETDNGTYMRRRFATTRGVPEPRR